MKKLLFASVAAISLLAGAAHAQETPITLAQAGAWVAIEWTSSSVSRPDACLTGAGTESSPAWFALSANGAGFFIHVGGIDWSIIPPSAVGDSYYVFIYDNLPDKIDLTFTTTTIHGFTTTITPPQFQRLISDIEQAGTGGDSMVVAASGYANLGVQFDGSDAVLPAFLACVHNLK